MSVHKCPECGANLVTDDAGQSVCSVCGLVVDEVRFSAEEKFSERFFEIDSRLYGEYATSVVPGSFVGGTTKALALSNMKALGKNSTYLRGVDLIRQVCAGLRISKNVEKRSIYLLGPALNSIGREMKMTVSSIAGGALLYALREEGVPISFKELYNYIKFKGKRITASKMVKAYRKIVMLVGKEPPKSTPEAFANRIVNLLAEHIRTDFVHKELIVGDLRNKALRCIRNLPENLSMGKNPYVLAAGAVRYTLVKSGLDKLIETFTDAQFSSIVHVTEYSLKEYTRMFEQASISFD
ncbi:MAG: TFIIB-type zinc ribbon-containing protein [Thermoprotei archaeon]